MRSTLFLLVLLLSTSTAFCQEICNNGIDDDNNGLIDLNDPQCTCATGGGSPTSLIPNPSFETQDCCPMFFSELNCATGWIQASDATSDYINTCNNFIPALLQTPLGVFPDGNGVVGAVCCTDYQEYVGACLTSPLLAGTAYTLQMDAGLFGMDGNGQNSCSISALPPLQWTIFGSTSCSDIPFSGLTCPTAPFIVLGTATLQPDQNYHVLTFTFTPTVNITTIVMGPPCNMPAAYPSTSDACFAYTVVDNLILNTSASFTGVSITSQGNLCQNNLVLTANPASSGGTYQWYKDGVAIIGQTNATLNYSVGNFGDGVFQVVYTLGTDCAIDNITLSNSNPLSTSVNSGVICPGETLTLTATGSTNYTWSPATGLSATTGSVVQANPDVTTVYTVTSTENGCTTSVNATVTVAGVPNFSPNITPNPLDLEHTIGQCTVNTTGLNYTWVFADGSTSTSTNFTHDFSDLVGSESVYVIAQNSDGCIDTVRIVVRMKETPIYYVPNSFTPDGDEFNNTFQPIFVAGFDPFNFHFTIFNRWGELIFESNDASKGWDGTYHGKLVPQGIYTWNISFKDPTNDSKTELSGHVSMIR